MRLVIAASVFALMAACAPVTPETPVPPPPASEPQTAEATAQDTCGAQRFQHLIGTPADQIDRASLPPRTRIITPDSMVTQDFSPGRLNIFTGTDGRVSSLRCF